MKLTQEDIKFIDDFLILKRVKYLDVRVELLDHLSTDFEENSEFALLKDYLDTKDELIKTFEKKRHKNLHWHYQKQIWVEFLKMFYTLRGLATTSLVIGIILLGLQLFEYKIVSGALLITCGFIMVSSMFAYHSKRKKIEKLQSSLFIFAILAGPSLPLYFYAQIDTYIESNLVLYTCFWTVVILLNIIGAKLVHSLKKDLINYYERLEVA